MRRETIADVVRQGYAWRDSGYVSAWWEECVCWVLGECFMPAVPWLLAGSVCLAIVCWVVIAIGVCRENGSESQSLPNGVGSETSLPGREVRPGDRERVPAGSGVRVVEVESEPEEDDFDREFDREWN